MAAALAGQSAVRAVLGPGWRGYDDRGPIEIAVARDRRVGAPPGYRVRRTSDFGQRVLWNAAPPRVRLEEAAVDVVARQTREFEAIAVLADICHSRRTTAARVRDAWAQRSRLRRRVWLGEILDDIARGTCSVLEHGYLTRIERSHGLPHDRRQAPPGRRARPRVQGCRLPASADDRRAGQPVVPRHGAGPGRRPRPRSRRGSSRRRTHRKAGLGSGVRPPVPYHATAGPTAPQPRVGGVARALRTRVPDGVMAVVLVDHQVVRIHHVDRQRPR
jgi:hypothetical protein